MKSIFPTLLYGLFLGIFWMAATGQYSLPNYTVGSLLGVVVCLVSGRRPHFGIERPSLLAALRLSAVFVLLSLKSSLQIARDVLSPKSRVDAAVVALPLDLQERFPRMLLACLITLTPGTLAVELDRKGDCLFVHCLYADEAEHQIASLKEQYEKPLLRIFRS